jgi:hypothetical protein
MNITTTELERELIACWKYDGASPRDIAEKLAARRKRVSEYVKPRDGEPGPRRLARMFSGATS